MAGGRQLVPVPDGRFPSFLLPVPPGDRFSVRVLSCRSFLSESVCLRFIRGGRVRVSPGCWVVGRFQPLSPRCFCWLKASLASMSSARATIARLSLISSSPLALVRFECRGAESNYCYCFSDGARADRSHLHLLAPCRHDAPRAGDRPKPQAAGAEVLPGSHASAPPDNDVDMAPPSSPPRQPQKQGTQAGRQGPVPCSSTMYVTGYLKPDCQLKDFRARARARGQLLR